MNRAKLVYFIIFGSLLLLTLALVVYYLLNGQISADTFRGVEMARQEKSWDVDFDGAAETVSVIKYRNGSKNQFEIAVLDQNNKHYSMKLSGFEDDISYCPENELIPIGQRNYICIRGYVGVHSENIQLVVFEGTAIWPVKFKNDFEQDHLVSDAPNFAFANLNNDNLVDFYIDNRNYEKDPTLDIFRSYYYFIEDAFVYNHVDEMHFDQKLEEQGKIN